MTLKEAANGLGIYVGTAMTIKAWDDQTYMSIIPQEFDLITAENSCKMSLIINSLGDIMTWFDWNFYWETLTGKAEYYDWIMYDYQACDKLFDFAKKNKMHFRGHAAIWGNVGSTHYTPQFIQDETDPAKIEAFMKNYIQTTVARYKGQGVSWDVVNEAMDVSSGTGVIRDSVYNKVDDYICKAFTWAREADPTALLFYNDFNHATVEGYW